jgi:hypothetical protein
MVGGKRKKALDGKKGKQLVVRATWGLIKNRNARMYTDVILQNVSQHLWKMATNLLKL